MIPILLLVLIIVIYLLLQRCNFVGGSEKHTEAISTVVDGIIYTLLKVENVDGIEYTTFINEITGEIRSVNQREALDPRLRNFLNKNSKYLSK